MTNIKEGDFFKVIEVGGRTIELRYGYYVPELERGRIDLMPIYPDFKENPLYTTDGYAIITADQDICEHFKPKLKISKECWCNDCAYIEKHEEFISICHCPMNRERRNE